MRGEMEMDRMRLQKYLAKAGIASRRKAEELIRQGRIAVNGKKAETMGIIVSEADRIEMDGRIVRPGTQPVYIMLNKPAGYVTTVKDQFSRPTVMDLVRGISVRIYPVGRLDYNTSGLLLMTSDGEFTYKMTHPKHKIKRVYIAEIEGVPDETDIRLFESGLDLGDFKASPAEMRIVKTRKTSSTVEITVREGKNRQVRRMCEAIGHPVIRLKRIAIGNLSLGDLKEGEWRYLKPEEVQQLLFKSVHKKENPEPWTPGIN